MAIAGIVALVERQMSLRTQITGVVASMALILVLDILFDDLFCRPKETLDERLRLFGFGHPLHVSLA